MKVWIVTQFYKPEPSAPSARLGSLAKVWQKQGADVSVLTALPNHPTGYIYEAYQGKGSYQTDEIDGVKIYRHWLSCGPEKTAKRRLKAQATFAFSLLKNLIKTSAPKPDVVLASSPSILPVLSAWLLARRYKAKFVFEIRESWPGLFVELGRLKEGKVLDYLMKVEMFLYKRADAIVTVTPHLAKDLVNRGIPKEKISVVMNGVDKADVMAAAAANKADRGSRLRTELQIGPMTQVVMYFGDHDIAQALGQVVDTAKMMVSRGDVLFLLVGEGPDKDRLKNIARGMPNLQFIPLPEEDKKWAYYDMADVCLVPQKNVQGLKKVIPSKLFEAMAAGKPVVAAADGVTASTLTDARVALVVPPENSEKLAYAVLRLVDNPDKAKLLGMKGQQWLTQNYDFETLGAKYLGLLQRIVSGAASQPAAEAQDTSTSNATPAEPSRQRDDEIHPVKPRAQAPKNNGTPENGK